LQGLHGADPSAMLQLPYFGYGPGGIEGAPSVMQPPRRHHWHPCRRGFTSAAARGQASEPLPRS